MCIRDRERAVQIEFAPLKGKVLEKWIAEYVAAAGHKIDRQALEYLSSITVSYTHLDVYKRQTHYLSKRNCRIALISCAFKRS